MSRKNRAGCSDGCTCSLPPPPPYGLVVRIRGCGCGCYNPAIDPPFPTWTGQSGAANLICGYTVTIKSGPTVVTTCTASSTYPCTPCRFLGLTPGTYTIIVTHPKYATYTATYTYVTPTKFDRIFSATLCESSGHCMGCPEPIGNNLTLSIARDLSVLANPAAVHPIPTYGLSVPLTWGKWPWWSTVTLCSDATAGPTIYTNSLADTYAWYGEATTVSSMPVATWIDRGTIRPCDDAGTFPICEYDLDCSHWSVVSVPITLRFMLWRCKFPNPCPGMPDSWKLTVFGPPTKLCHSGPYCSGGSSFFLSDNPDPMDLSWTCPSESGTITYCNAHFASSWDVFARPAPTDCGYTLSGPAPTFSCNPFSIDFLDFDDITSPIAQSIWGTVTDP